MLPLVPVIDSETSTARKRGKNPNHTIKIVNTAERILALDLGKKRIGLAISDELGITAQGLDTLERRGRREDIETLRRLAVARGVTRFLIGDPLHMSGDASRQGDYTREFASELGRKTGLPIEFRDERWTSREAERTIRGAGVANRERKPTIDKLSAVILLQSYLDSMVTGRLS
jgi:putative Holliday junction resolvase